MSKTINIDDLSSLSENIKIFEKQEVDCQYRSNTLTFPLQGSLNNKSTPLMAFMKCLRYKRVSLSLDENLLIIKDRNDNALVIDLND